MRHEVESVGDDEASSFLSADDQDINAANATGSMSDDEDEGDESSSVSPDFDSHILDGGSDNTDADLDCDDDGSDH
jgi:hypothetical protein